MKVRITACANSVFLENDAQENKYAMKNYLGKPISV